MNFLSTYLEPNSASVRRLLIHRSRKKRQSGGVNSFNPPLNLSHPLSCDERKAKKRVVTDQIVDQPG